MFHPVVGWNLSTRVLKLFFLFLLQEWRRLSSAKDAARAVLELFFSCVDGVKLILNCRRELFWLLSVAFYHSYQNRSQMVICKVRFGLDFTKKSSQWWNTEPACMAFFNSASLHNVRRNLTWKCIYHRFSNFVRKQLRRNVVVLIELTFSKEAGGIHF